MGKGDKKTRRGKIVNKSYGIKRPRKKLNKVEVLKEVAKNKKESVEIKETNEVTEEKITKKETKKKAPAKKTTKKESAKKTTAKKTPAKKTIAKKTPKKKEDKE